MGKLWSKTLGSLRVLATASLILALINSQLWAVEKARPGTGAMMIDVPVRILSLCLTVVSTAIFIVALPFALASSSTGDAWDALVVEPLEFTFTRPLGQFEDWRSDVTSSDKGIPQEQEEP